MQKIHQDISHDGLVTELFADDLTDELGVRYTQDCEPSFELVQQTRNDGHAWRTGVKQNMVHALHIPSAVVIKLWEIGVNVYQAPLKDIKAGLLKLDLYRQCDMTGKRIA